jgi:hypothetical protein
MEFNNRLVKTNWRRMRLTDRKLTVQPSAGQQLSMLLASSSAEEMASIVFHTAQKTVS